MPILSRLIVLALALLLAAPAAAQGKRVALVIGNATYAPAVGPLANPGRDAALVADALRARGFAVTVVRDAGRVALQQAVDRHARALASAGSGAVGFFYYSGHGVANPDTGRNYVVPVDAVSAGDDRLWYESVPLQDLIGSITRVAGEATNIVVFDACREALALPKGKGLGGGAKGLERVTGVPSTLIAFSTSPGALAADRDAAAATGPYATELAGLLRTSSDDLSTLFENVKFAVFKRTGRKQLPWVENGLVERVYLGGGVKVAGSTGLAKVTDGVAESTILHWSLTRDDLSFRRDADILNRAGSAGRSDEIRRMAAAGDATANLLLGIGAEHGIGGEPNLDLARRHYQIAAEAGLERAQANLGNFYLYGKGGVPKDPAQAVELYRRAADAGNADAMVSLATAYTLGTGVAQDKAAAHLWSQRAAAAGHGAGMMNLAVFHLNGIGTPVDRALALEWYRKADAAGQPDAKAAIDRLNEGGR